MPLSQAKKILGFMVHDNHIDGDVVELINQTELHRDYAKRHLSDEQQDIL